MEKGYKWVDPYELPWSQNSFRLYVKPSQPEKESRAVIDPLPHCHYLSEDSTFFPLLEHDDSDDDNSSKSLITNIKTYSSDSRVRMTSLQEFMSGKMETCHLSVYSPDYYFYGRADTRSSMIVVILNDEEDTVEYKS